MKRGKAFEIPKALIWKSYLQVKQNQGAPGCDGQTIKEFEEKRNKNLYKIWNRMCSGSYLPPPVVEEKIPKGDGKERGQGSPSFFQSRKSRMLVFSMYIETHGGKPMSCRALTELETAEYTGLSQSTLRQGRMNGQRANRIPTPPFVKLGRCIRYLKDDLDQWLEHYRQIPNGTASLKR